MENATPELLTVDEVAAAFRQTRSTVYRKLKNGELEAVRLGSGDRRPLRIPREQVDRHFVHARQASA